MVKTILLQNSNQKDWYEIVAKVYVTVTVYK